MTEHAPFYPPFPLFIFIISWTRRLIDHGDRQLYVTEYLRFLFTEPQEKQAVHFIKGVTKEGLLKLFIFRLQTFDDDDTALSSSSSSSPLENEQQHQQQQQQQQEKKKQHGLIIKLDIAPSSRHLRIRPDHQCVLKGLVNDRGGGGKGSATTGIPNGITSSQANRQGMYASRIYLSTYLLPAV